MIQSSDRFALGKSRIVEEFVARENIKRFEAQLAACTDSQQRETLSRLLEEARHHLNEARTAKPT
jgi:hypothetical protein